MSAAPLVVELDPPAEAVVLKDAAPEFERIRVSEVELQQGEVLVEVELSTVCGSDLHTVAGKRSAPTPLVLGHEQVGRIVALGPGHPARTVSGEAARVGDRVVWGVAVDCGECARCLAGYPQKCLRLHKYGHERLKSAWMLSGGIATHVHLLARTPLAVIAESVPAEVAAPASCATATVVAVIDAAADLRPLDGETVLVSGCGMLGLTAVALARQSGATVVAVDTDPRRRALAEQFGAAAVTDASGIADALARATGSARWGVALELSGSTDAIEALLPAADIGGVLVLAGSVFPSRPVALDAEAVVRGLVSIRGVHNYRPEHLAQAVAFLERADHAAFAALVVERVPFARAERALQVPPAEGTRTAVAPRERVVSPEAVPS